MGSDEGDDPVFGLGFFVADAYCTYQPDPRLTSVGIEMRTTKQYEDLGEGTKITLPDSIGKATLRVCTPHNDWFARGHRVR